MHRALCPVVLLFFLSRGIAAPVQIVPVQQSGPGAMGSRSAFVQGYVQGYERSYHLGNIDANMARPPRKKMKELKGVPRAYKSIFGSKKSYESGFDSGLKAGYGDGYYGRTFRALRQLHNAGFDSAMNFSPAGPAGLTFDAGVGDGYRQGFDRAVLHPSDTRQIDFHTVSCERSSSAQAQEPPRNDVYCEGYRRGFTLGHADGAAPPPGRRPLEASK